MLSINEARVLGYAGDNPEVRIIQRGEEEVRRVARFSVATTERWKDKKTGELVEKTEWHRVVAFGRLAEVAEKYVKKGSLVQAEGRLRTKKWQDDAGMERSTTTIELQGYNSKLILLGKPEAHNSASHEEAPVEDILADEEMPEF